MYTRTDTFNATDSHVIDPAGRTTAVKERLMSQSFMNVYVDQSIRRMSGADYFRRFTESSGYQSIQKGMQRRGEALKMGR